LVEVVGWEHDRRGRIADLQRGGAARHGRPAFGDSHSARTFLASKLAPGASTSFSGGGAGVPARAPDHAS
jgi:hypothetical protein